MTVRKAAFRPDPELEAPLPAPATNVGASISTEARLRHLFSHSLAGGHVNPLMPAVLRLRRQENER